jgi:hypothetical protein
MYVYEYWRQFEVVERKWYYVLAGVLVLLGVCGCIANTVVLIYLIKYDITI